MLLGRSLKNSYLQFAIEWGWGCYENAVEEFDRRREVWTCSQTGTLEKWSEGMCYLTVKNLSLPQIWAEGDLRYLHGAGTRREIEAVQLVASVKDAAGWGVGIVEWSSGNGHRIREARRGIRNSEVEEVGDEVQRYSLEKHKQNGSYQRQHKGQKARGKIKVETLTTYYFLYTIHTTTDVNLNYVGVES